MAHTPYLVGRNLTGLSRPRAFAVVTLAYVVAALAGALVTGALSRQHPLAAYLWADIVATIVVFAFSMAVANSSLYDPYWSVAPPLILAGWLIGHGTFSARQIIVLVLLTAWAVRLTANWAVGWSGLAQEDWRYIQIREQTRGRLPWWLVSFLGIQLMPTLVVYAGMLSAWAVVVGSSPLNALDVLAALVTVAAIALETVADLQLRRFAADPASRGRSVDIGLWRRSRHPNYLGEIGLWWGLWLFGLAAAPDWWWTIVGPLIMVALFLGVSVPLMEKRSLERRADYAPYQRNVPMLLPWRKPLKSR